MSGILTAVAASWSSWDRSSAGAMDIHIVAFRLPRRGCSPRSVFMTVMATRRGMRLRPSLRLARSGSAQRRQAGGPADDGAGLNPVARLAEQVLVSFLPPGSITLLNYGYRLISAIGAPSSSAPSFVALIPRLTEAHNHDDQEAVSPVDRRGMRIMLGGQPAPHRVHGGVSQPGAIAVFHRGSLTRAGAALLGVAAGRLNSISLVGIGRPGEPSWRRSWPASTPEPCCANTL